MNYNVWLTFLFRICDGVATGIWSSSVLSNFISVSQGNDDSSKEKVGIAQAVQGTALVAAAIPAAWLASHLRRDTILKFMGLVAFAAIGTTTVALLYYDGLQQYFMLCGALALWGVAQANGPVLDTLFADSVPTGKRATLYTSLHIAYILSQGLGPAVAALVFFVQGDVWDVARMRMVMLCGMALALLPAFLLMLFNDDKSLGEESEGLLKVLQSQHQRGLHEPLLGGDELGDDEYDAAGRGHLMLTYPSDEEHDLEGFDARAIHSPLTGQDLLSQAVAQEPGTPTRTVAPPHITAAALLGEAKVDSFAIELSDDGTVYSGCTSPGDGVAAPLSGAVAALGQVLDRQLPTLAEHAELQMQAGQTSLGHFGGTAAGVDVAGTTGSIGKSASSFDAWLPNKLKSLPSPGSSPSGQVTRAGGLTAADSPQQDPSCPVPTQAGVGHDTSLAAVPSQQLPAASSPMHTPRGAAARVVPRLAGVPNLAVAVAVGSQHSTTVVHATPPQDDHQHVFTPRRSTDQPIGRVDGAGEITSIQQIRGSRSPSPPARRSASPGPRTGSRPPADSVAIKITSQIPWGPGGRAALARGEGGWSDTGPLSTPRSKVLSSVSQLHEKRVLGCLGVSSIPGILAFTDCVMGLASGMTIKFFPIFFRERVHLSPVFVNLMYCGVPLSLSLAAALANRQSTVIGKVPTMVLNRAIGIALLYWIALHVEIWQQPGIMVPVYIVRTSIMNANYPIQRTILMDYVSKEHRAKWASLESVTSFGWSGSAALGGWLIHHYGFQLTFLVTATMQLLGWMCSLLLLPIVPCFDMTPEELSKAMSRTPSRQTLRQATR